MESDSSVFLLQYIIILQLTVWTIVFVCVCENIWNKNAMQFIMWKQDLQLFKKYQISPGFQCWLVLRHRFCLWHEASFAQEISSNIWGCLCGLLLNWRRLKAVLVFWRVWEKDLGVYFTLALRSTDPGYLKVLFLLWIRQRHRGFTLPKRW